MIADLTFAAANLPVITAASVKDGEVTSQAANHLLAEVYVADGQFQNAITAANAVINSTGMGLMTSRFDHAALKCRVMCTGTCSVRITRTARMVQVISNLYG